MKNGDISQALKALNELAEEAHGNGNSWVDVIEPRVELIQAAMLDAPLVPPAGAEVEVFAYYLHPLGDLEHGRFLRREDAKIADPSKSEHHGTVVLVDRAHVTRLQADCEALAIMHRQAQVKWCSEREALKADVKRLHGRLREEQTYVSELAAEHTAMESELTKARELLEGVSGIVSKKEATMFGSAPEIIKELRKWLAHQSAPAAKGGES